MYPEYRRVVAGYEDRGPAGIVLGRYVAQRAKQSVGRAERLHITADRRQGKVRFSFHQAIVTKKGKSRRENFPKIKIPNRMRKQYVEKRNFLTRLTGS